MKRINAFLCFSLYLLLLNPLISAQAAVTYNGTNGVFARIFNDNFLKRCLDCHNSALVGSTARNGAPTGVNFNTYALATGAFAGNAANLPLTNASVAVDVINADFMPAVPASSSGGFTTPPPGGLGSTLKGLMTTWETGGFLQYAAPTAITSATITGITRTSATVNGSGDPNGATTAADFQYGVSPTVTTFDTADVDLGSGGGNTTVAFNRTITGLTCGTTYSYRARTVNTTTVANTVTGVTRTFTTSACDVPEIDQGETIEVAMSVNGNPNAFTLQLSATSVGSVFTWDISEQPVADGGTASVAAGTTTSGQLKTINYVSSLDASGSFSFTVRVTDQSMNTDTIVVIVNVGVALPVIDQGATLDAGSTPTGMPLAIGLSAMDFDSAALTWSVATPASFGSVVVPQGATLASGEIKTITYTPNADVSVVTADTFSIQVADESGNSDEITITVYIIPEGVLAGYIRFDVKQGSSTGSYVMQSGGLVTITGAMSIAPLDPDALRFNWSDSHADVLNIANINDGSFSFAPATLSGHYIIDLRILQNDVGMHNQLIITVIDDSTIPAANNEFDCDDDGVLTAADSVDCDGDGILNLADGMTDSDDDGILNFLDSMEDPVMDRGLLPNQSRKPGGSVYLVAESGLTLRTGRTARFAGRQGALVSAEDIADFGGTNGQTVANAADSMINLGGIFDFEIAGLSQPGATAKVVIPLASGIQVGAEYRKYKSASGWGSFVVNANNSVSSARKILGVCPAVGSSDYVSGLTVFHNCVQLMLEDGGPNDADGEANGVIRDPGGVSVVTFTPEHEVAAVDDGSGGGVWHPVLLLLSGLWLIVGLNRRRKPLH